MNIQVIQVDYQNKQQSQALIALLNAYACDPMGGGHPLKQKAKRSLIQCLQTMPQAFSVLAYRDKEPVGLINCFEGFSTFACQPLVNIHDVYVLDQYRGLGISTLMLDKVESIAISKGCCKLTLEVLSKNSVARHSYQNFGFTDYQLDPAAGHALFWQKKLTTSDIPLKQEDE